MLRLLKICVLILLVGFFFGIELYAVPFRKLRVEEGLSHNTVHCIMQDRLGYIWIGTADGLNCYTGNDNKIFRNWNESAYVSASNYVTALLDNDERSVWIGTNRGIYIYKRDKGTFSQFDVQTNYGVSISSEVRKMLVGADGTVWIATLGQGLFRYDGKSLKQFISETSFVSDLVLDSNGNLYAATLRNELLLFGKEGDLLGHIATSDATYSLFYDRNILWVGMENGSVLNISDSQAVIASYTVNAVHSNRISSMEMDESGGLLIGTDYGLYRLEKGKQKPERIDNPMELNGLSNSQIIALTKDKEGGIWVATNGGGVNYMPSHAILFDYYNLTRGETEATNVQKTIGPVCKGAEEDIYIGTNRGVYRQKEGEKDIRNLIPGTADYDVRALWFDKGNGTLWIGTYGDGLIRIDNKRNRIKAYRNESGKANTLSNNYILDLYRDSDGILYIGMNDGLCQFDEEEEKFFVVTAIAAMVSVSDICEDSRRNLWIATSANGIYRCNKSGGYWKHYQYEHNVEGSLFSNNVTVLKEDHAGNLWIGTNGRGLGMFHADSETFDEYDPEGKLLPSKVIYAIEQDGEKDFWVSTNMGLVRFSADNKNDYRLFTSNNGLQTNQFSLHSSLFTDNGKLVFGGMNGLNVFSPSRLSRNLFVPPVYVTGISFSYGQKRVETDSIRWENLQELPSHIVLPYEYNSFSLNFSVLSYEDPTKNIYRYRMENVDKEWIVSPFLGQATYTNLSPGTYRFSITGANNDGVWNDRMTTITIVITPPWWFSLWAKIIYGMLFLLCLAWTAWLWNRYVKRKYYRRMEEYNVVREKEMYRQKISFFVNLVHEIRTPLTLIRLPLEQMRETTGTEEKEQMEMLEVIDKNVNYLLDITNQLLDFQKIESGMANINKENCDINQLVKDVCMQFVPVANLKDIKLMIQLTDEWLYVFIDRDKISKIMVNLLSNALKYTHTRIAVGMTHTGDMLKWYVDDDGEGVSGVDKDRIFKAFYRVHEEASAPGGTGIGLAYARLLAEKHGGTLSVEDNEWGGARFVLNLPVELADGKTTEEVKTEETQIAEYTESTETKEMEDGMVQDKRKTILMVEDNTELLRMAAKTLAKWYYVKKASNGQQALDVLEMQMVDVIVSDVMMPVMDGLELCRCVKQNIKTSHIPLILLTAKTTLEAKTEGMVCGADAYVEKPFSIHQLKAQIENLLRLRQLFHQQMLSVEGCFTFTKKTDELGISQRDCEFAARMQYIIDKQLSDENFSVDSLAEELGMSRSSFYRKIKGLSGMSPNDYLKTIRLNKAAELIRQGERVGDVCFKVGFGSSSYFAKCFKSQFGVLPKDYLAV